MNFHNSPNIIPINNQNLIPQSNQIQTFFDTELGQQWLNVCLQIFSYSVEKIGSVLLKDKIFISNDQQKIIDLWSKQIQRVYDWNQSRISEWMEVVIDQKFSYCKVLWENSRNDSPLILLYVKIAFHFTPGTLNIKIPCLADFLHCAFSIFFKNLIDYSMAVFWKSVPQTSFNQIVTQQLKSEISKELCKDAIRTAFVRIVNPCIKIDTRPSFQSASQIMGFRRPFDIDPPIQDDDRMIEKSQHHKSKSQKVAEKSHHRHNQQTNPEKSQRQKEGGSQAAHRNDMTPEEKKIVDEYVKISRNQHQGSRVQRDGSKSVSGIKRN